MQDTAASTAAGPELRTLKILMGLALVSLFTAALAGIVLLTMTPESGSALEGALGLSAASAGLATAGFSIAAAIYAQVKNLWRYAPMWVRGTLWVVIGVGIATTIMNLVDQLL